MEKGAVSLNIQSERCSWLDLAKGIAIVLVVLGHSLQKDMRIEYGAINVLHQFIYSFHMQLFMFLSGVAHAIRIEQGKSVDFKYKIKKQLIPWGYYSLLIYVCIGCVAFLVRNSERVISFEKVTFSEYFLRCIAGNNPYVVHTWFLLALFLICVLFDGISKLSGQDARWLQLVAGVCFLIIRIMLMMYTSPWLDQLKRILQYYIFFAVGDYLPQAKESNRLRWIRSAFFGTMFTVIACVFLKNKMVTFAVRQIGAVFIIQSIVLGAQDACKKKQGEIWCRLGRHSYQVYLLHHPWCSVILGKALYSVLSWNIFAVILICAASSIILPLLFVKRIQYCGILKLVLKPLGLVKENE